MKVKQLVVAHWIIVSIFSLLMLIDAIEAFIHVRSSVVSVTLLGYPEYVLTIIGIGKIIGVIAIMQPQYPTLKEWGFAGFAINFVIAFLSWFLVGGWYGPLIPPLIMSTLLVLTYILWKQSETTRV